MGREVELTEGYGAQERRLADAVAPDKTVAPAKHQREICRSEEGSGEGRREGGRGGGEGRREGGRREGGGEGGKVGVREGGREEGREGGREEGREEGVRGIKQSGSTGLYKWLQELTSFRKICQSSRS